MSEEKKKYSKLCLVGFILSAMPIVILAVCTLIDRFSPASFRANTVETIVPGAFLYLSLPGLIVSIAGVVSARKSGRNGKLLGIVGIALPGIPIIIIAVMIGSVLISSGSRTEMNDMGEIESYVNTDYDVSQLRLPEGYDLTNITVSEAELKAYSESKLQTISSENYRSIKGKYQDYNFLIIRSDKIDVWLDFNRRGGFKYYKGYASIYYEDSWEFAATRPVYLDVYKDPSDKFIVITNCNDYKVVSEFFGITDNYIEPVITTEETLSSEFYENHEQIVFLRNNINEDMSLPEIVDVFEQLGEEYPGSEVYWFRASTYHDFYIDSSTGEYVSGEEYYRIYLERWVSLDEGLFRIDVYIYYEPNTTNRNIESVNVSTGTVDGDFFDYVRGSAPYEYASKADIVRIEFEMDSL